MHDTLAPIQVHLTRGHKATIAVAWVECSDGVLVSATGEALRHPTDKDDTVVGDDLATSRALAALARRVGKRADGKIKCNDDNARHSRLAARRRAAAAKAAEKGGRAAQQAQALTREARELQRA